MNLINVLDIDCGGVIIPNQLPDIISKVVMLIKIFVPILLIIWGMLDLGRAVIAQKEDEIKKGQHTLITRIIAAAIVFFVFTIVSTIVSLVADPNEKGNITSCMSCFINGPTSSGCNGS